MASDYPVIVNDNVYFTGNKIGNVLDGDEGLRKNEQ